MSDWIGTRAGAKLCSDITHIAEHLKGIRIELRLLREQPYKDLIEKVDEHLSETEADLEKATGDRKLLLEGARATLINIGREIEAVRDQGGA